MVTKLEPINELDNLGIKGVDISQLITIVGTPQFLFKTSPVDNFTVLSENKKKF